MTLRLVATLAMLAMAPAARAHAFLDHAEPRVGSSLARPPAQVMLWFNEELDTSASRLRVLDARGKTVDRGDPSAQPGDRTTLRVALPPLAPGKYTVKWRAVSRDAHATEGDFTFEVKR